MPLRRSRMPLAMQRATSSSQTITNGMSEPRTPSTTGRSNIAVMGFETRSPRIVPGRNTSWSSSGCSSRARASISSTWRLWSE